MDALNKKVASPVMVIIAFATVYIVWGSTYFFIQKAIVGFPPLLLGAIRFLIAGVIMLAWTKFKGEQIFVWQDIKHATVSGLLMLFVGTGVVMWVEQYLPSAMVAIMVSSGPLWFILLDRPKWTQNFKSKTTIGGLVMGFVGVLILFSEKIIEALTNAGSHSDVISLAMLIIGSMAWAGGSLYSKYKSANSGSVAVNSAWQMLTAGLAFIPVALLRGDVQHMQWHNISTSAWLSLWYLVFMGSIAGFSAYVWLLQVRPATQVSTHAYVNPVVAVLLGFFFAGENITITQVLGLMVILTSVLIINLFKYRQARLAETPGPLKAAANMQHNVNINEPVVNGVIKTVE